MEEKRTRINSGPAVSPHKIVPQPRSNSHNRKSVTPPRQNPAAPQPITTPPTPQLQPPSPRPALPVLRPNPQPQNYQILPGETISHRKNIDRLMEILKSKSKGKDRQQKSLHKIFKWLERTEKYGWLRREQQHKKFALFRIKQAYLLSKKFHVQMTKQRPTPVTSLEFIEKPADRTSANLQQDDQIHNIVDAHQIGSKKTLNSQDFSNTLSRNIVNDYSPQSKQSTPKKLSKDLYILSKRSTAALLTTKTPLPSLKSDPKLLISKDSPITTPTRSIDNKGPNVPVNTNTVQHSDPFTLRKKQTDSTCAPKVQQKSAQTPAFNKAEEADIIEHGEEKASPISKFDAKLTKNDEMRRSNRLMEASASRKRLISFNYNGKGEPITTAQTENYYILNKQPIKEPKENKDTSQSRSKVSFTYAHKEKKEGQTTQTKKETNQPKPNSPNSPNTVAKGTITPSETSRMIRVNSNKVLTASVFQPVVIQTSQQSDDQKTNQVQNHVITRKRCNSMPKITFSYKGKEEVFVSPLPTNQILHKNSPIFQLEQIHKEAKIPTRTPTPKKEEKEDPYLSKNIQIRNIVQSKVTPNPHQERPVIKQQVVPQNNYYIPVVSNLLPQKVVSTPASKPAERPRIISTYQTLPSTTLYSMEQSSNIAMKVEEYYGPKKSALLSPTPADKIGRDRVRSIDAVLKREVCLTNSKSPQDMLTMQQYRQRPRSLSSKMQVTIRKRQMIAV